MPSLSALFSIALYWFIWLLVASRLLQSHTTGEMVFTLGWLIGTAALAAWFTWIKMHDDRQARRYGEDGFSDDEPASPASRFFVAVMLGMGGFACLTGSVLVPELRTALMVVGFVALVCAVLFLFFGGRSTSDDIDV